MEPCSRLQGAVLLAAVGIAALSGCQRGAVSTAPTAPPAAAPAPAHTASLDSRMASELQRAEDRANLCSAREAKAAGLTAEYFAEKGLAGARLLVRQEGPLDHPWPRAGEDVKTPVRSARWRGWVRPPFSGRFSFHTELPGARISVSGQQLTGADSTVELHAGRYHPILVELRSLPPVAAGAPAWPPLKLSWTTPFGARYLLPRAVLYPPSDTVDSVAQVGKSASKSLAP